jgi:hypothetical protein
MKIEFHMLTKIFLVILLQYFIIQSMQFNCGNLFKVPNVIEVYASL